MAPNVGDLFFIYFITLDLNHVQVEHLALGIFSLPLLKLFPSATHQD